MTSSKVRFVVRDRTSKRSIFDRHCRLGLLSGGWVITSKSGCKDRGDTDPDYANANWYGLGIGVCVAD